MYARRTATSRRISTSGSARVVNAKIEDGVDPRTAGALWFDDQNRRRLPPANVAAFSLGRVERREESIDQLALGAAVRLGHRGPHRVLEHHVGLHGKSIAHDMPRFGNRGRTGVRRDLSVRIDHRNLPHALASDRSRADPRGCQVRSCPRASGRAPVSRTQDRRTPASRPRPHRLLPTRRGRRRSNATARQRRAARYQDRARQSSKYVRVGRRRHHDSPPVAQALACGPQPGSAEQKITG